MHTVHLNVIASEAFVSTLTELVSRGCPSRWARLNASRLPQVYAQIGECARHSVRARANAASTEALGTDLEAFAA